MIHNDHGDLTGLNLFYYQSGSTRIDGWDFDYGIEVFDANQSMNVHCLVKNDKLQVKMFENIDFDELELRDDTMKFNCSVLVPLVYSENPEIIVTDHDSCKTVLIRLQKGDDLLELLPR